jgi:hypothetical protein
MAKSAPAFPFAPDEIVVALDGFASYPNIVVAKGTRLRASSEAVQRNPMFFCRDGLTVMEMQNLLEQRFPRHEPTQHVPIMREEVELRPEDSMLCVKGVRGRHRDGDTHLAPAPEVVGAGAHVPKDHPLIKLFPDSFDLLDQAIAARLHHHGGEVYVGPAGRARELECEAVLLGRPPTRVGSSRGTYRPTRLR